MGLSAGYKKKKKEIAYTAYTYNCKDYGSLVAAAL